MTTENEVLFVVERPEMVTHFKARRDYHLERKKALAEEAKHARAEAKRIRALGLGADAPPEGMEEVGYTIESPKFSNRTVADQGSIHEANARLLEDKAMSHGKLAARFAFLSQHVGNAQTQTFTVEQLRNFEFVD